jgi:predicted HAD superfamily hydrolase
MCFDFFEGLVPWSQRELDHGVALNRCAVATSTNTLHNSMVSFYLSNSNNNRKDDIFMSDHIEKMQFDLPTHYFHIVFTIPHELNTIAFQNQELIYSIPGDRIFLFIPMYTASCQAEDFPKTI